MLVTKNTVISSVVSSSTSSFISSQLEGNRGFDLLLDTIGGMATGLILESFLPVDMPDITTGKGNMSAVYNATLTKLYSNQIKYVSLKTIGKGFTSGYTGSIVEIILDTLKELVTSHLYQNNQPEVSNISWTN